MHIIYLVGSGNVYCMYYKSIVVTTFLRKNVLHAYLHSSVKETILVT